MKIKKITKTDKLVDMYDVCNTKNGRFVANGFVVHNSAAEMTKKSMIKVDNDERLNALDCQLIIPVHDELIVQAPLRNAREVKERFAHDMETAAIDKLTIPISCDVTVSFEWYGDELDLDKELEGLSDD